MQDLYKCVLTPCSVCSLYSYTPLQGPPPAPTSQAPTKVIAAFPIANAKSQRPLGPSEASFKVDSRHPGARQPGARGPGSKGPSPQRQPSQTNLQGGPAVASARGQRQSAHDPRPAARPLSAEAAQQKPKAVGVKKLGRLGGAAPGAAAAAAPPPQPQAAPSVRRPPPPGGSILADVKYAPHVGLGMRPYVEPEERVSRWWRLVAFHRFFLGASGLVPLTIRPLITPL